MSIPIQRLGLPPRALAALLAEGIETVDALAKLDRTGVRRILGLGDMGIADLVVGLAKFAARQKEPIP